MNRLHRQRSALSLGILGVALCFGCDRKQAQSTADAPRLIPGVTLRDVTFHTSALNREMPYRVILPTNIRQDEKLPVVYVLHGGGGGYRDWSNYSDVAQFAAKGLILVMPEGGSSYYTNSATVPQDRFEDYIVKGLISNVETRFPAAQGRPNRAIAGVSMGGFGAVKIALRYPDLYVFAGGISPALDVPTRAFSIKRIAQWRFHSSIFGPEGSETRKENDPFLLSQSTNPATAPYFFLTCGDREGLLPANRKFAASLQKRGFSYEFHVVSGDHDWAQWGKQIPDLFQELIAALKGDRQPPN